MSGLGLLLAGEAKRSRKDDESIIRRHLRPRFGAMKVQDIGVEDGDDYISSRDHLSVKTMANHITLLTDSRLMCNSM